MKINPISIYRNIVDSNDQFQQAFGQSAVVTNPNGSSVIPSKTPDYNVRIPISYKFDEEINLPNNLKAYCYKLANGQRVVIVPKEGATVVKSYVNTGSFNEPDKIRGISHYIEHNLFNGSEDLGDKVFFDEVNKMGAFTNASTSFSVTDYYISSQLLEDSDLENKIKLHAGMLQSPKFLEDKLAKEKDIVNSEINMCLSDESSRAESITLKNLFNIKSNSPDLVAGSTDNIDSLTREDVVNYFNNNYYPANIVTVVTGEVEPDVTISLIAKYFNSQKQPVQNRHYEKLTPIDKPIRQDLISNKKEGSAEIYLGFAGPENSNIKDKIYLRAVESLLMDLSNSRLKNLEHKYCTNMNISTERLGIRPEDQTAKIMNISAFESDVEPLLKELYAIIENLGEKPPTEEEFQAIKNQIKKTNSIYMQSSAALNQHIGMDFLNGTPYNMVQYDEILDNMTYEDFIHTAKKYFDLNKVALTVVHPSGTKSEEVKNNYEKFNNHSGVTFTGLNKKTPINLNKVEEYKLPNNFDVILHDEDTDVIDYSLVLDTNTFTPHKAAVADILCDMINYETAGKTKEEMDSLFDKNGIDGGVIATDKLISAMGNFPLEKTTEAMNLFKERIQNPNFTEENFKKAALHCMSIYLEHEPSAYDDYDKAIYKNTSLGSTNIDKLTSIPNITLDDVKALYTEIFSNSQGSVVVTGPFSKHPELRQKIFSNIASYPVVRQKNVDLFNSYIPVENAEVHTVETKRNQAEVLEGFKFKQSGNLKDHLCFSLLNTILGDGPNSRLFNDLREQRHLCYSVGSTYETINDIGVLGLRIQTTTNNAETGQNSYDNIQKSIEGFNENINRIKSEKVSQEELERAKKTLKSQILSGLEMNEDKNAALLSVSKTPYGLDKVNQELEMIDNITTDDILNAARYIFAAKPIYSISGTKESLAANQQYLYSIQ